MEGRPPGSSVHRSYIVTRLWGSRGEASGVLFAVGTGTHRDVHRPTWVSVTDPCVSQSFPWWLSTRPHQDQQLLSFLLCSCQMHINDQVFFPQNVEILAGLLSGPVCWGRLLSQFSFLGSCPFSKGFPGDTSSKEPACWCQRQKVRDTGLPAC